jgi:hypothetical protein
MAEGDLLFPKDSQFIQDTNFDSPLLCITVDTEEEFDWNAPFSRLNTRVSAVKHLHRAHSIFRRFSAVPTYVVDYPIVDSDEAWTILQEIVDDGSGLIGAQLHPWVTPPHTSDVNEYNSFPGNLPKDVEAQKIRELTNRLIDRVGFHPAIYKAGRYGVGPNTAKTLADLGYKIDMSVHAHRTYSATSGPDFTHIPPIPYWFHDRTLLEIPLTAGFLGFWRERGIDFYRFLNDRGAPLSRLPAIASRLNVINRVSLTPEGVPINEAIALTKEMLVTGRKVFSLAFHSPSLEPGNTQYVRSKRDLVKMLDWLEIYLEFFLGRVGGRCTTPLEILELAKVGNLTVEPQP